MFVAVASPKACGGRCGSSVGRSALNAPTCPSVLGLAAPSRNSLRALRALRSDKRDESDDERASRWAASPPRLGAPQARRTGPPHALGDELLVAAVAFMRCAFPAAIRTAVAAQRPLRSCPAGVPKVRTPYRYTRASRQAQPGGGDLAACRGTQPPGRCAQRTSSTDSSRLSNAAPAGRVQRVWRCARRRVPQVVGAFSADQAAHASAPAPCRSAASRRESGGHGSGFQRAAAEEVQQAGVRRRGVLFTL